MNIVQWLQMFGEELKQTSALEYIGVGFGVAEVLYAKANKVWLYPTGIISVIVTMYLYYTSGLYAETLLNVYYLIMSIYGWWFWVYHREAKPLPITKTNKSEWFVTLCIVVGGFALLWFVLQHYTNSTVPVFDAWVTATAWAGMWLLAKRKIENWILLNISNVFSIPLLFYKHLPLYALLTVFLFVVAVQGYYKWRRICKAAQI